jgi:hypothetical protein
MAVEHCEKFGKQAVWYGHDRNGFIHYKCQLSRNNHPTPFVGHQVS